MNSRDYFLNSDWSLSDVENHQETHKQNDQMKGLAYPSTGHLEQQSLQMVVVFLLSFFCGHLVKSLFPAINLDESNPLDDFVNQLDSWKKKSWKT